MTSALTTPFTVPQPSVEIERSAARFPVHRIYCVGRNYAAHVEEMGGSTDRDPPIFFQKPTDAVVASGSTIAYPTMTGNFHYEVELVIAIGKGGRSIPEASALIGSQDTFATPSTRACGRRARVW